MRSLLVLSLAVLGCTPQTTVVGGEVNTADGDTGASGDTGDSGNNIGDTDTQDTAPVDTSEGEYEGTIEASIESDWGGLDCSGPMTLSVDASGIATGYITCEFDESNGWGPPAQEGDASGAEAEGVVDLLWVVEYQGGYTLEIPGTGSYLDGTIALDFDYDMGGYGTFVGTADLARQ